MAKSMKGYEPVRWTQHENHIKHSWLHKTCIGWTWWILLETGAGFVYVCVCVVSSARAHFRDDWSAVMVHVQEDDSHRGCLDNEHTHVWHKAPCWTHPPPPSSAGHPSCQTLHKKWAAESSTVRFVCVHSRTGAHSCHWSALYVTGISASYYCSLLISPIQGCRHWS